jgi:four helix bundle protein
MIESYKDLIVYKKSYEVSIEIHKISLRFPSFEKEELGNQIRRASKSIPMNIAEGYGKNDSIEDFRRYFRMALGSCEEVKVQLEFCKDLGYMAEDEYKRVIGTYNEVSKMLVKILKDWKKQSGI